jgi:sigma-B regulation protein RsbU (phosphoserine phosphatase)
MDGAYYKDLWSTILDGRVFRKALINRKKNGELYEVDQTITPMRDQEGRITHFVAVVKDMTDYRKVQEQEIEMKLASLVQRKLYPKAAPRLSGFDIAGAVFPAEAMCGDYYDFIEMPGGPLAITIGDVSGHGFGPALIMAQTRAYLRALAQVYTIPGDIIDIINGMLSCDLEEHLFVTLFLAVIDPVSRSLVYASAGHLPGYILDASGEVKSVMASTGVPLGILSRNKYATSRHFALEDGDIVVLLTDGVSECAIQDDRYMEDSDILEVVRAHRHEPARNIVDYIHTKTSEFARGAPQCDDITMVVCKVGETIVSNRDTD